MRRWLAATILCGADATVLCLVRPHPAQLGSRLTAPAQWLRQAGPDAALADVAATLLWFLAGWLAVGIAATVLASLPGRTGRLCATASRRLLPAALRRVVAGAAGLGVLLGPLPAAVATGGGPAGLQLTATALSGRLPAPQTAPLPGPVWPGAGRRADPPDEPPSAQRPVRVQPGDSLWVLAAHRLGPGADPAAVAAAWPRWYAANRAVIGGDPNLIRPGQLLRPPDGPRR